MPYDEAIKAYSEVIKINKRNVEAYYNRGLSHLFNNPFDFCIPVCFNFYDILVIIYRFGLSVF